MSIIAPSLLSANFLRLKEEIKEVECAGAKWIHYDVMDGHFVPNISFGPGILKNIRQATDLFLDIHLMIEDPLKYLLPFIDAGADLITFHIEACANEEEVLRIIHTIKMPDVKVGISIKPFTPIETISSYLGEIDLVLIMSVEPGFGGQKFQPQAVDKIRHLRKLVDEYSLHCLIEVDGGINQETGLICKQAGADVLVAGSYIFNGNNIKESVAALL